MTHWTAACVLMATLATLGCGLYGKPVRSLPAPAEVPAEAPPENEPAADEETDP